MKARLIHDIEEQMAAVLTQQQREVLRQVLAVTLKPLTVTPEAGSHVQNDESLLQSFISSKRVEGCSEKTLRYYESTIRKMLLQVPSGVCELSTDALRRYLDAYAHNGHAGKQTIDNIRRILSSFFSWLEDEDYILKSPVRRIHKVKIAKTVKATYSDEMLERLRDGCKNLRDLALIDMLSTTGMRVGELVRLNRDDIDFEDRECVVLGKGNKERKVYFDARVKIHLKNYLASRTDDNPALFVSLQAPHRRLEISGVEIRLRAMGRALNIPRVHPHKFRRTLATMAIDKGMPIEQVQHLLGHQSVDTTLRYAMVSQTNVKLAHRRYIA